MIDLFDYEAAKAAKDAAMKLVDDGANKSWKLEMEKCVIDVARENPIFTSDHVAALAIDRGIWPKTRDRRALGPVMVRAARDNICRKADQAPINSIRRSRHGAPLSVWKSLLCG